MARVGDNWVRRLGRLLGGIPVTLAILLLAGMVVTLFITRWDAWVGASVRQTTDDAYVAQRHHAAQRQDRGLYSPRAGERFSAGQSRAICWSRSRTTTTGPEWRRPRPSSPAPKPRSTNLKSRKALQHAQIAEAQDAINATQADVERTRKEAVRQQRAARHHLRHRAEGRAGGRRREALRGEPGAQRSRARRPHSGRWRCSTPKKPSCAPTAKAKRAALDLAKINLGYTRITAPVDGMVSERGVRAGQYVHAGTQVISVVPLDNVWVVANYKETQLTHVAIGQRAEITIDTFPGVVIKAAVDSISPASGSQFSLLPPDNATGNFTKVVQRIPVKIALDPDNPLEGSCAPACR